MNDLFKVLSVYVESIQGAVQTLGTFLATVREGLKTFENPTVGKTQLDELSDLLIELEFKNADLAEKANVLVVEILDTFLKLHSNK